MKKLKQYILIIGFTISTFSMIGCKNSVDSNSSQNDKTDARNDINTEEIVPELIEEELPSKDFISKVDFKLPKDYKFFDKIHGDLNGDDLDDDVLFVKETDKEKIVVNRFDEEVDRNRRGILIYLTSKDKTVLAIENLNCFSSENEDGGAYIQPELSIDIENGKLHVQYGHGYINWKYTFRYQNSDFELIGFDLNETSASLVNRAISINYLTKKKLIRENVNQNAKGNGDEIFEDTWEDIDIKELYRLSEITDFDELNVDREN